VALIYQLVFFSLTGYLVCFEETQWTQKLFDFGRCCHLNFLILCDILIEKFPAKTITRNVWANKLQLLLKEDTVFNSQLNLMRPKEEAPGVDLPKKIVRQMKYRMLWKNNS